MDSFEKLYKKNNQKPSAIYGYDTSGTVYSRTNSIASGNGVAGFALNALKEACASEHSNKIILVDYEKLCKEPSLVMERIYDFLDLDKFAHNFNDVEYNAGEFDKKIGVKGLHDVRNKVEWRPRETILPQDLFNRFIGDNFWKDK